VSGAVRVLIVGLAGLLGIPAASVVQSRSLPHSSQFQLIDDTGVDARSQANGLLRPNLLRNLVSNQRGTPELMPSLIASATMSRFWLLVLMFIVPVQMSWAAVHFCSDEASGAGRIAATLVSSVNEHQHEHEHAVTGSRSEPESQHDCCGVHHGCHGLHNLMSMEQAGLTFARAPSVLVALDEAPFERQFAYRHERPQWSVA